MHDWYFVAADGRGACISICVYVCMCIYMHVCIYIDIHRYRCMCVYVYVLTHAHTTLHDWYLVAADGRGVCISICVYVCMCIYMHVCIYIDINRYRYIYIYMYEYSHTRMLFCTTGILLRRMGEVCVYVYRYRCG